MRRLAEPVTVQVDGRDVVVREVSDRLFNAFDAEGKRLAILAPYSGGVWWRCVRVDGPTPGEPRKLHCPAGLPEATRRILTS